MKEDEESPGRRRFLKGASIAWTAALAAPITARSDAQTPPAARVPLPSAAAESTERDTSLTQSSCGGDFMVDVMRALGIEHVAATPGNTFMGLHEAVINYGMLTEPMLDFITTMHEEASVAMSHGYAKVEGKPMACMMHTAVGLQHGSMAIYNAWADRAPIFMIVGSHQDAATRHNAVDWAHTAADGPALVRDFTKWDDTPGSLSAFSESAARAYKFAMTPPYGPVLLAIDTRMQEDALPGDRPPPITRLPRSAPPQGEEGAVRETARLLVAAENPVIMADRAARTPEGLKLMIELAETLQAPVIDLGGRMNFPWRHALNQSADQRALVSSADVVLGLEMGDFWGATNEYGGRAGRRSLLPEGGKRISISSLDLFMKSNYQDFQRFAEVDLAMAADAEATLPALIEAVKQAASNARRGQFSDRGARLAQAQAQALARARSAAAVGWDDSPITVPRLCAELYEQIRNEDWALASGTVFQSYWPQRLWAADKHYQFIGDSGAYGVGYTAPASLGAALAHKKHGRLSVALQGDGDLMFGPGILWTAAHERIPLLYVVHNNRAYHMEIMQLQAIANRRQRGIDRVHIGTTITAPNIDYAQMAKALGVFAIGPIDKPQDLGPALKKAIAVVKRGEPALVDVVSQGR
ncbi:MAG TPA: thiamine pyrophosphate-dependent enzyme [Steroidobacteraceae bacterium]